MVITKVMTRLFVLFDSNKSKKKQWWVKYYPLPHLITVVSFFLFVFINKSSVISWVSENYWIVKIYTWIKYAQKKTKQDSNWVRYHDKLKVGSFRDLLCPCTLPHPSYSGNLNNQAHGWYCLVLRWETKTSSTTSTFYSWLSVARLWYYPRIKTHKGIMGYHRLSLICFWFIFLSSRPKCWWKPAV